MKHPTGLSAPRRSHAGSLEQNIPGAFTPLPVGRLTKGWTPLPDTGVAPQHTFSIPLGTSPKVFMRLKVTVP